MILFFRSIKCELLHHFCQAEEGYSLEQCSALATRIADQGRSIGVALSSCIVPAAGKPSFSLPEDEIEFGIGIHGEPGIRREKYTDGDTIVSAMLDEILDNPPYVRTLRQWDREKGEWFDDTRTTTPLNVGDNVIVLVNGLGGTPASELYGVYRKVAEILAAKHINIARNLVGTYCSAIDMQGVSITVLKADDEMLSLWDFPVSTPALAETLKAAEQGMKSTIPLRAAKGRTSYLGERAIGHLDPGATSSYLLFKTLCDVVEM